MAGQSQRVTLAPTCIVDLVAPEVAVAAVRVMRSCGIEVAYPLGQTCCGQPAWNAGFPDEAARVARQTLEALDSDDETSVVVLGGSCATMQRLFWPELFELVGDHDAAQRARRLATRTSELSEFLVEADLPTPKALPPARVAYHHSCHMLRELRIEEPPLALLDGIEGCLRVEWDPAQRCCGFGGLFATKLPEISIAMADEKLATAQHAGAEVIVGCDTSCLLHLRTRAEHRGLRLEFLHLAQLLAASLPADRTEP